MKKDLQWLQRALPVSEEGPMCSQTCDITGFQQTLARLAAITYSGFLPDNVDYPLH
eukprot:CAMPEP_0195089340 /NCGR_PEP_ID=MMETSP0448-20130528/28653_1 /TAXON_ID=66468 /ORGANISM="Heterocapsa triquestra, Strain CCMP 448" /LENGTH=55 /DNA_ID=CAMNT_0040123063 /DNA_START=78 /DNA_END=242 /DNA_ORIENTATION=+